MQSNADDEEELEKVYSLARPLAKRIDVENEPMPDINIAEGEQSELIDGIRDETRRKNLFVNCRFWINREAPKDMLAIIIRLFRLAIILYEFLAPLLYPSIQLI